LYTVSNFVISFSTYSVTFETFFWYQTDKTKIVKNIKLKQKKNRKRRKTSYKNIPLDVVFLE